MSGIMISTINNTTPIHSDFESHGTCGKPNISGKPNAFENFPFIELYGIGYTTMTGRRVNGMVGLLTAGCKAWVNLTGFGKCSFLRILKIAFKSFKSLLEMISPIFGCSIGTFTNPC